MYCPKCGTQNSEDASFCSKCGNDLKPTIQAEKKEKNVFRDDRILAITLLIIFFYSLYLMVSLFIESFSVPCLYNPSCRPFDSNRPWIALALFFVAILGGLKLKKNTTK